MPRELKPQTDVLSVRIPVLTRMTIRTFTADETAALNKELIKVATKHADKKKANERAS